MNKQSNLFQEISTEIIRDIFVNTLQEEIIWETALLDGGLFNTTYIVEYSSSHKKAVLRLGPVNRHLLMGFEENLMNAEVYTYSICQTIGIPCSKVLACDTSKKIIDRDFMIVEYIPSVVMSKAELIEETQTLRHQFYKSRELLDEIRTPHLLHTDLWEGNVLLDRDTLEIAAIIDSDRAM